MDVFIPPDICNGYQLAFLVIVYGYILFAGSRMISDGSELLLLVPSISGMIGSVVLPVLGAVPDSLMVLFSGLGPNPQETVSVGVGALAGSTIMLLTIPWFLSVMGGRVHIVNGEAVYKQPLPTSNSEPAWEKLSGNFFHWTKTGVSNSSQVMKNAVFMMKTSLLYLVIQVPALCFPTDEYIITQAALVGFVLCVICWIYYIYTQYLSSKKADSLVEEMITEAIIEGIRNREITLVGAMKDLIGPLRVANGGSDPLLGTNIRKLRATVAPFFRLYEDQAESGVIGFEEFKTIMRDLGVSKLTNFELESIFKSLDKDGSETIDFDEFVALMVKFVRDFETWVDVEKYYLRGLPRGRIYSAATPRHTSRENTPDGESVYERRETNISLEDEDDGDSELDEVPEGLENLSPEQQQVRIKFRSFCLMAAGTFLILIFSDPAVEVLSEVAARVNVSPFFVSFVLAPLASNASEVIASYNYSMKKTRKTMKVSLTTLEGAACMNNTLCLAIFLGVIYFRNLAWEYTAETISILFVQFAVGTIARKRKTFRMIDALCILALYPLSLIIVETLKWTGIK